MQCKSCGMVCQIATASETAKNPGKQYFQCPRHCQVFNGWLNSSNIVSSSATPNKIIRRKKGQNNNRGVYVDDNVNGAYKYEYQHIHKPNIHHESVHSPPVTTTTTIKTAMPVCHACQRECVIKLSNSVNTGKAFYACPMKCLAFMGWVESPPMEAISTTTPTREMPINKTIKTKITLDDDAASDTDIIMLQQQQYEQKKQKQHVVQTQDDGDANTTCEKCGTLCVIMKTLSSPSNPSVAYVGCPHCFAFNRWISTTTTTPSIISTVPTVTTTVVDNTIVFRPASTSLVTHKTTNISSEKKIAAVIIRCQKCHQKCFIKNSKSAKNRNKPFYACPKQCRNVWNGWVSDYQGEQNGNDNDDDNDDDDDSSCENNHGDTDDDGNENTDNNINRSAHVTTQEEEQ